MQFKFSTPKVNGFGRWYGSAGSGTYQKSEKLSIVFVLSVFVSLPTISLCLVSGVPMRAWWDWTQCPITTRNQPSPKLLLCQAQIWTKLLVGVVYLHLFITRYFEVSVDTWKSVFQRVQSQEKLGDSRKQILSKSFEARLWWTVYISVSVASLGWGGAKSFLLTLTPHLDELVN